MDLLEAISALESSNSLHEARILLLINAFAGENGDGQIEGLTKLAKLDFLLRYPTYLERALVKKGRSTKAVDLKPHEELSVESKMVRYRFGPWDHRYPNSPESTVGEEPSAIGIGWPHDQDWAHRIWATMRRCTVGAG